MIESKLHAAIVNRVPQILNDIQRHIPAGLLQRLLPRNRPRQIDNPIFTAVDQVNRGRGRRRLGQSRIAAVEGNHPRCQTRFGFNAFQRHNRPLREADQRRRLRADAALLLPVAHRFNKGRHNRIYALLAIFFADALDRKPLASRSRAARLRAADADDKRIGKERRKPATDLPHGHRVIADAMKQQQQLLCRCCGALNNKMIVFHGFLLNVCKEVYAAEGI